MVHSTIKRSRSALGFTFAELAFAFLILVTLSMALLNHVSSVYRRNTNEHDKVQAYTHATSILAELQSYVNRSEDASADSLDVFDDGTTNNYTLTITKKGGSLVAPDHPLSGNVSRDGEWLWARRISVRPFPGLNNRNVRYVTVKVYKRQLYGEGWDVLADLSGVVNSVGSSYPPSQEYDVYLLALENIPGWWVHMDAIRPFIESTITDLEARNPGVKFRTHWITKAAYGRNQLYTPYVNLARPSTDPIPSVYMYPGLMPTGSASTYYYVPDLIDARISLDGTLTNGYDAKNNPYPYAMADKFNHAMRLEDERALFNKRVSAGLEDAKTPTWRLLLEDMATDPSKFHNAILVNLHGELLPMPAMRNFSDAAKSPDATKGVPGLRVVTHPSQLRYVRNSTVSGSEDVQLRVYAYQSDMSNVKTQFTGGKPITLQVMNVDLTKNVNGSGTGPATLTVENLPGGVDPGNGDRRYAKTFQHASTSKSSANTMYYDVSYVDESSKGGERYTLLHLYNTPSIAPLIKDGSEWRGLSAAHRLYGLEYIPCSIDKTTPFSTDLGTNGVGTPKNTARWRITIHKEVLDGATTGSTLKLEDQVLAIRTRIGDKLDTGVAYPSQNDPDNLSSTYVYWVRNRNSVPITERSQFLGDPRHCPYADLLDGGANFPNGYNWYFDDLRYGTANAQTYYKGLSSSRLMDRWRWRVEMDYPRYAQVLRQALVESEAIYTTLTGFSYYYIGLGNEIGYDSANGYPSSIPISLQPYGQVGNSTVDNISSGGNPSYRYQKIVREAATANYWWGVYWLGELYPDSSYADWLASKGNLPAGGSAKKFYRSARYNITRNLPYGTRLYNSFRRTQTEGCTSIFNIGTTSSTFHHQFASGRSGTLEGAGLELAQNYNFPLPTTTKISRPFGLKTNGSGTVGSEWNFTTEYPRYSAIVEKTYYRHQWGSEGSSLVGLTNPSKTKTAHIVVNGLDRTVESGSAFIAKYAILSLLHSYFEAGNSSFAHPITLPPRLEVTGPTEISELTDPSTIAVTWKTAWKRWDGKAYTGSFAPTYSQSESDLDYVLMYSTDNGKTFKYMADNSDATPGSRPSNPLYLFGDAAAGDETYDWDVSGPSFVEGSYLLRVECYRKSEELHYSFHQVKIYIQR